MFKRSELDKIMQAFDERSDENKRHYSEMLKIYKEEVEDLREQVKKLRKEVYDLQEGIIKMGSVTLQFGEPNRTKPNATDSRAL